MYEDRYWEFHDRVTWEAIRPHLPESPAEQCCDLGCGTGKWGMKLLKCGFATTFVDHSGAMIELARQKIEAMGSRAKNARLIVGDIVRLEAIADAQFELILAMGDPLSICSDPQAAVREMRRICKPGGAVIATADNKLAAIDHYFQKGDLPGLEELLRRGRTRWLTSDEREQFELTTFTPAELSRLFERGGLAVDRIMGKTILPIRTFKESLEREGAFEKLMRMELELQKDPSTAARAAHLQIVARRRT